MLVFNAYAVTIFWLYFCLVFAIFQPLYWLYRPEITRCIFLGIGLIYGIGRFIHKTRKRNFQVACGFFGSWTESTSDWSYIYGKFNTCYSVETLYCRINFTNLWQCKILIAKMELCSGPFGLLIFASIRTPVTVSNDKTITNQWLCIIHHWTNCACVFAFSEY